MDKNKNLKSANRNERKAAPAFQRRYEFLLWLQLILFIGIFIGTGIYYVLQSKHTDTIIALLYAVMLLVFISTVLVVYFQFIIPAKKLIEHIISEHRGTPASTNPLKMVPQEWKPWFNIITWLFEKTRVLETKIESKNIDQQLGTNLLRRFSWVFERNENLTRELQAKNIELEKEIEMHKNTTMELKRHRDHLNEMVRERATDLYHTNKKLEAAIKKAEEANQAKSQFLANVSHAVRTPLNAMIGFTDLLTETSLNDVQRDFVETIRTSSGTLLELISDILDLSKIESDGIVLESIDFSMELLVYDICEMIRPEVYKKSVGLSCHIDNRVPAYVKGDSHRIQQILSNLLNNASKFTEAGEILLSIDIDQETDRNILIHCKVKDTGVGIPENKVELIFDPFQQADESTTRKYGGTGLGLSIARRLATQMGGNVFVESEVDVGSTFHFTALLERSDKKESWQTVTAGLSGKQILIVDDSQADLNLLANALKSVGVRAADIRNYVEVLPTLERALIAGNPFDCCIIDINMPGMNGHEIAHNIRAAKDPRISKMPLIASSFRTEREPILFAKSGYNQSLIKPVRREKLFQVLDEVLIQGESPESTNMFNKASSGKAASDKVSFKGNNILVAEDDVHSQKLIKIMLENAGCFVTVVSNGREVVDRFYETPHFYDMILMDIRMPVIDGFGAFQMIRKMNSSIPVIAITAHAFKENREECIRAGMNGFLAKPIRKEMLLEILNKYLKKKIQH